jgi:3-oxoacyl-[acyl-carrier protein] reductase
MFRLDGKVAIVTGGASGIGAATARALARAGADVAISAYSPDGHDAALVRDDIRALGRQVLVAETDVRDTAQVTALVAETVRTLGRIDVVIANAAIARRVPAASLGDADWSDLLDVDLTGVWRTFRAAIPHLLAQGAGRLLATASTVGNIEAWPAHVHYSAAKAGIAGLVRSLAAELGPGGITVNAIAPGIIETPQTLDAVNSLGAGGIAQTAARIPVRRAGRPDDIAHAYVYLASDEASFVTGQLLVVDGGRGLLPG